MYIDRPRGKLVEFEVFVNGKGTKVWNKTTVLEACRFGGGLVPTYCDKDYVPGLECRVCIVSVEGVEEPIVACSSFVWEGMRIWTSTPKVVEGRRGVMGEYSRLLEGEKGSH